MLVPVVAKLDSQNDNMTRPLPSIILSGTFILMNWIFFIFFGKTENEAVGGLQLKEFRLGLPRSFG